MGVLLVECKLIHGDCIEEMQKLIDEGVKVDLILTDPPYGVSSCNWDSIVPYGKMWDRLYSITYETSPILLFSNDKWGGALKMSNDDYKYQWVWNKEFSSNFMQAKKTPLIPLEYINVFYRKQPTYNPQKRPKTINYDATRISESDKKTKVNHDDAIYGTAYHRRYYEDDGFRMPINLLTFNSQAEECNNANRLHPFQKPIRLLEYLIKTYTNENDTVLDFTMGSGSTGVACLQTHRNFIGIELEEKYYNIAKERCKTYQTKLW